MSNIRIQERLSTLVSSQLPEFISTDYTTFVAFLEAYYEYLEQDTYAQELLQNARQYSDIDTTVESFIDYFIKQYINNIPKDVSSNKKLLVKNISDLYNSKGSKKSYELLFRLLFNKSVDIFYPSTQVLRASDGKWKQKTSFFMEVLTGSPESLINNTALIKTDSSLFPIVIESIKSVSSATGIVSNIKEFFYINDRNLPLEVGNVIEYLNFKGRIVSITSTVKVVYPGTGFKVGDILPLTSGIGKGSKLKVSKVTSTGGIRNAVFISYGYGYQESFYNFFTAFEGTPVKSTFIFDVPGGTVSLTEATPGFSDYGTITKPSYSENYFANDYEGELLRSFYTNTSTNTGATGSLGSISISTGSPSDATIFVELGPTARYPGYYETSDGFLSDDIFLENEDYYQPFTYVLKLDERLEDYKKAVLDLLHPAGTRLLGELLYENTIDVGMELTSLLRYLISRFQDEFAVSDNVPTKNIEKPVNDSFIPEETIGKHVGKPIPSLEDPSDDNIDVLLETISKNLGVGKLDSVGTEVTIPVKEIAKQIGDPGGPYGIDYFAEDYTTATEAVIIQDEFLLYTNGYINREATFNLLETGYILNPNYATDYSGSSEDYAGEVSIIS